MSLRTTNAAALGVLMTAATVGAQSASIEVANASAAGALGDPGNTVVTGSFAESFIAKSLTWSGVLGSAPNPFFFEEDVFAAIEGPGGIGYAGPIAGEQGIFLGSTPFRGWTAGFAPGAITGDYRFEAYAPNAFPASTNWSISDASFAFNAALFPDAQAVGVGDSVSAAISEGEIQWYSIDHAGGGLEISTAGSQIFELDGAIQVDDTLIALFDASGMLVDFNDDASATDFTSLLTFDALGAGEYRLAVTGSTLGTRVGTSFISTSHDGEGTVELAILVPAPGVAGLLLNAGLMSFRRRR